MTPRRSGTLHHLLLQTGGWALLTLGLLTMGYGMWASREARSYLLEVEASGQVVETFDAVNYLMSGSGLYLLLGALLVAHGAVLLALRRILQNQAELPVTAAQPVHVAESEAAPSTPGREDGAAD